MELCIYRFATHSFNLDRRDWEHKGREPLMNHVVSGVDGSTRHVVRLQKPAR